MLFKYWSTTSKKTPIILSLQGMFSHFSLGFDSFPFYPVSASDSRVLSSHVWSDFAVVFSAVQNALCPYI